MPKISATFHRKEPVPGLDYASQGYHMTIEAEPPPDVQQDREKLRRYVEALFQECRDRVEAELASGRPRDQAAARPSLHRDVSPSRRPMRNGRASRNGHARTNGHSSNGTVATPKQLKFVRALGANAGLGYDDIGVLALEMFGVEDVRAITKKQASALIDELRDGARG